MTMTMTTRLLPSQRSAAVPSAPRSNNSVTAGGGGGSGGGYESSSSRAPRRPHKKLGTTTLPGAAAEGGGASSGGGSLLWTCCIFGLVATVVNLLYIAKIVLDRHDHLLFEKQQLNENENQSSSSSSSASSSSLSVPKTTTTTNDHKKNDIVDDGDKGPILNLLYEAGFKDLDEATLARLPSWSQVASLYGPEPVYFGLDSCQAFQNSGNRAEHFIGTAGTFNTGTNLMAELLIHNCHMPDRQAKYGAVQRGIRWQVQWGKHTPVFNETFRKTHQTYKDNNEKDQKKAKATPPDLKAENIFPAVTVRDPYKWMQSMCRHKYAAKWNHTRKHCPSLVPNAADVQEFPTLANADAIPVRVKYAEFTTHHDSMVGFWNDWYNDYVKKNQDQVFPFLLVRFEDVVYHPKNVTQTVCECAGGQMDAHHKFRYIVDSAKRGAAAHGDIKSRTSYLDALIKYGTREGRYNGYEQADLDYVRQHLDPHLMQLLGYPFHDNDDLNNAVAATTT